MTNAVDWLLVRLRTRLPRVMAAAELQLPRKAVPDVYTDVPPAGAAIPNVVHQTWSRQALGRSHRAALRAFRRRNPDYSFRFYDDAAIDAYMAEHYGDHPIIDVYRGARFGPLKTDVWRYCVLYERGGVYVDIGKTIGRPLNEIITPGARGVISWEGKASLFEVPPAAAAALDHPELVMLNWAMMFAPGHPFLKRVIDGIVAAYPRLKGVPCPHPKASILDFTGPHFITKCLLESAAAGETADCVQAGVEFDRTGVWQAPGAWVRYMERPAYDIARGRPIVV